MAGDILLYQTDLVPIGDDQRQHLELARDVAERFNTRFGETFVVPEGVYPEVGARIMDLQEPTRKMATTGGTAQGTVRLLDDPDAIRKKFKSRRHRLRARGAPRPRREAGHLEPDRDPLRRHGRADRRRSRARYDGAGYGTFKAAVGEAVVELLRPIQAALRGAARATKASCGGCSRSGPTRRAKRRRRRSRRCTSGWASLLPSHRKSDEAPPPRRASARATRPDRGRRGRGPHSAHRCKRSTGCPTASQHPAHLTVAPLVEHELDAAGPSRRTPCRRGRPVFELDPAATGASGLSAGSPSTSATYVFSDAVARMGEPVGEVAVVRQQERSRGVNVEPPDRHDARRRARRGRRPCAGPAGRSRS